MQKKKICMVGDFSVGKTSLTQKFVNNVFCDKYLSTIGVKIDTVEIDDSKLIVWDVAGRDSLSPINASYLVGAAGVILVCDGTRANTVVGLLDIWDTVKGRIGNVPVVVAINKGDLPEWSVSDECYDQFSGLGWDFYKTSARDGHNVELLFKSLLAKIKSC